MPAPPVPRDTVLPHGISTYSGGHDELLEVPPPRQNWTLWLVLLIAPTMAVIAWASFDFSVGSDRAFAVVWYAILVSSVLYNLDLLTRRTTFACTRTMVQLESTGLLGPRRRACARPDFRVGDPVAGGRQRLPYLPVYFGSEHVKVLRGWQPSELGAVVTTLRGWPDAGHVGEDVVPPGSRLRVAMDGRDRAVEVPAPVTNAQLWWSALLVPAIGAAWATILLNGPSRNDVAFWGLPVVLLILWLSILDVLTARMQLTLTPKYAAMVRRSWLRRSSQTCAAADFTIGGIVRVWAGSALRLHFGGTSVRVAHGASRDDLQFLASLLTAWRSDP